MSRALLRAASGSGRADDRLVGMLQVLLKALDPTEVRLSDPTAGRFRSRRRSPACRRAGDDADRRYDGDRTYHDDQ
ncbi:MAG: hypothetical protein U1D55_19480 [Phycisphaerae bacterium]